MERTVTRRFITLAIITISTFAMLVCLSVTANAMTYVEKESNDTFRTANKITLSTGNIVKGTKKTNKYDEDKDYFYFNRTAPCKLKILFDESKGKELRITFFDKNRNEIANRLMNSNSRPWTILLESRAQYMCVDFALGDYGTYSVIFDECTNIADDISEPNGTFSQAKSLIPDRTYKGILNHYNSPWDGYDQIDYIKYDIPAGRYYINIKCTPYINNFHMLKVERYNSNRKILSTQYDETVTENETDSTIKESFDWNGGVLYLSVEETHDSMEEYSVYLTQVPERNSIAKLKAGKKKFTVNWTMKSYDGYYVRYSASSNMRGAKTLDIGDSSTTGKTIKGLKSKKKYYVQVRPYKYVDGEIYKAAWSAKKSIKTK